MRRLLATYTRSICLSVVAVGWLVLTGPVAEVQAASMTWGTPFALVDETGLDQTGTLVEAINFGGSTVDVNGISFQGSEDLGTHTFARDDVWAGTPTDADFSIVMDSFRYSPPASIAPQDSIMLSGLTPGTTYQFQYLGADQRRGKDTREVTLSDKDIEGDGTGNSVSYFVTPFHSVVGTFTADSTSQEIWIDQNNDGGWGAGYMLRDVSAPVPEPSAATLFTLGAVLTAARVRRMARS